MRPTPYETYVKYVAIKQHFTPKSSYDYFKYNGKTKSISEDKFEARPDRYMFYKLSRRHTPQDLELFLAWNFFSDPKKHISSLLTDESQKIFTERKKYASSHEYHFGNDMAKLDFPDDFRVPNGGNPKVLYQYYTGNIAPETLLILDKLLGIFERYNDGLPDDILWEREYNKLTKVKDFVFRDTPLSGKTLMNVLRNSYAETI